jgi:hypothetical protein
MSAIPLRLQLLDAALGTQQGVESLILPDYFSSGGSFNVTMDKYARVRRIKGYSAQGAAVRTNGGNSATRVRNLFPYRKTSGVTFVRQLFGAFDDATNEYEIWYSTNEGVTYTFVQDFGAGSVGSICDFAQFGDELYIANGVIAPRVWDGTTIATAGSTQLAAPSTSSAGTGVLSGSYKVKIVPRTSDGTRKAGSDTSTSLSIESKSITVGWVADADVTVVGYEEYRTTGTGDVFYFVQYIDGRLTVSATDNIEDLTILENRVLEEHGDPPPVGAYLCVAHKQRMWWLRTDTYPQRGSYSDPGEPASVYEENFVEFQDAETQGDLITGGVGNYEGMLVVFEERSIWTVSGTGQIIGNIIDFNRTRTNAQTGAVSNRAIVRVPASAAYTDQTGKVQKTATVALAYMTPLKDVRLFDGDNDLCIHYPLVDLINSLNYAQRRKVHTLHDTSRQEIAWIFPADSESEPSTAAVWNYRWGVWYEREWTFSAAAELESITEAAVLVGGSSSLTAGGITYELWDTNTFNGVAFTAQWMTKTLYGLGDQGEPSPSYQKRFRWIDVIMEVDQDLSVLVEWLQGDAPDNGTAVGSVTISPDTDTIVTASGDTIVTADGDELRTAAETSIKRVKFADINGRYLHDSGIRLRIGDSVSTGSWALKGQVLAYQMLPGLKRRTPEPLNP